MAEDPFDSDAGFPRLGEEVLAVLEAAGERRPLLTGEVLFGAGDSASEFFVILRGRVAIIDGFGSQAERVIGVHGEMRFVGELNLVTGQPAYLTAVVREPGEAIVLSRDELQAVVSANHQLGDVIVNAFIVRRGRLIGLGTGLRLIGSHLDPDSRRLREFLTRNRIPHRFLDLEADAQADLLLRRLSIAPRQAPLVLGAGGCGAVGALARGGAGRPTTTRDPRWGSRRLPTGSSPVRAGGLCCSGVGVASLEGRWG